MLSRHDIVQISLTLFKANRKRWRAASILFIVLFNSLPIMKETKAISELQYRIARYRSMGNGAMCQTLSNQLRALQAQN